MKIYCPFCGKGYADTMTQCPHCLAQRAAAPQPLPCSGECMNCTHGDLLGNCPHLGAADTNADIIGSAYPYAVYSEDEGESHIYAHYEQRSLNTGATLAFILGALGVHSFYLRFYGKGVAHLLLSLLTCGLGIIPSWIWAICEGIGYLKGKPEHDGKGVPCLRT